MLSKNYKWVVVISNQCGGVVHGGNVIIKNNKDNCGDLLSFAEPSSVVFDHTKNCSYCRCGAFERNFGTGEGGRGQEYEKTNLHRFKCPEGCLVLRGGGRMLKLVDI